MDEKRITDNEMSDKVGSIIDEVLIVGKKAARSIFDLMVERTAQTAGDLVDKKVETLKDKLSERESNDQEENN